ncbi:MAG: hypothetical protein SOI44_10265 [Lactimicrobium sp.]|uniref:hypothetical protein n=1 Tax=Lactimicrobium sp. TaxID=2563780 RepID=UPI002F3524A2
MAERIPNTCAPMQFRGPDLNKCMCRDCVFREKDRKGKGVFVHGALLDMCDVYPNNKPYEILFEGAKCQYYVKK